MKVPKANVPLVTRVRFQLLGGLFVAIVLPTVVRLGHVPLPFPASSTSITIYAAAIAIIAGYFITRRLTSFPGIVSGSNVLVCYAVAFALVAVALLMARVDYSRSLFAMSFGLSIFWFVMVQLTVTRLVRVPLALINTSDVDHILEIADANWTVIDKPEDYKPSMGAIVANLRSENIGKWEEFIADTVLEGVPAFHTKQIQESLTGKVTIEHLTENNIGSLLPSDTYQRLKQIADILIAVIVLPVFALICAAVWIANLIWSPGPLFFSQPRLGYAGEVFNVIKFRTMTVRQQVPAPVQGFAEEAADDLLTARSDPRITTVGRFLRRTRIDELPQLINVLKGEMSWVGPRPEAEILSSMYQRELPFYKYRHVLRPGITGWAQVNQGHVTDKSDVLQKLHYDFFYIKYYSPWLDILIAFRTVRIILSGFGAK